MNVKLMIQENGVNTLKKEFEGAFTDELKKIYVMVSGMKESGYEIFEEYLIDLKARKYIIFGVDKKYTTKKMLSSLSKYTKNVYIFSNEVVELEANIFLFEYLSKAEIYLLSGTISDSFFDDDRLIYTKIELDLGNIADKEIYKGYVDSILLESKEKCYEKLTKELIESLAETKAIFTTKQYVHNVMSIDELLGKKEGQKKDIVKEETKIPKVDLSALDDIDISIDTGDIIEENTEEKKTVKKKVSKKEDIVIEKPKEKKVSAQKIKDMVEEYKEDEKSADEQEYRDKTLDIESMLFGSSHVKLDRKKVDKIIINDRKEKKEEAVALNKKIDLNKVSNVIIELKDKPSKGKDVSAIKISNQIKDLVPTFFETDSKSSSYVEKDGGMYKESKITLEIIDVVANEKRKDKNAMVTYKNSQSYISIVSDELKDVEYKDGDLARIIKLSNDTYHIEIIPQEIEEYNLWKKLCNQELRGSSKRFGVM